MRRQSPVILLVAALVFAASLLSACQGTGGKSVAEDGVTANAVAGSEIEVTALDDPTAGAGATPKPGAALAGNDTAAPAVTEAATPEAVTPEAATPEAAPKADLEATPVTPKSEMQIACEKKGGNWFQIGEGDKRACVRATKDALKRCERESQCEGVCLARSGTCSPFKPMYGCHEILQDNGARVTLCLE
jgi:hypothetical protein